MKRKIKSFLRIVNDRWQRFWMRFAGLGFAGKIFTRLAVINAPPHKARTALANKNKLGYIDPSATIYHPDIRYGRNIFIGERVIIFDRENGGFVELGDNIRIYRDTILEAGYGAYIKLGKDASIHPRCQINAYISAIEIGKGVMIAPNCALYSYNHGIDPAESIRDQPLESKGPIIIDEEVWIGVNVTILSGVHIGKGAVIGAGSVVMHDVPEGAIVGGNPARIIKLRKELKSTKY